ncbi:unnamed protein product [Mytilus coruscus]|uniref:Fibronectin type-III domain-containing protein n=1 Tax=Mytilus coruscus TaxID=42192 RepID=A0A6J8EBJ2_MYTCO|nr:unnamed protein product [Mytilus coruscus]
MAIERESSTTIDLLAVFHVKLGGLCTELYDHCLDVDAKCVDDGGGIFTCRCKSDFRQINGTCIHHIKVGGLCTELYDHCLDVDAKCVDDGGGIFTCRCKSDFRQINRTCIHLTDWKSTIPPKSNIKLGGLCTKLNDHCLDVDAKCVDDGGGIFTCRCKSDFRQINGTCIHLIPIGGLCMGFKYLCEDINAHCIADGGGVFTCQCKETFIPSNDPPICTSTQSTPQHNSTKIPLFGECSELNDSCSDSDAECVDEDDGHGGGHMYMCQCKYDFIEIKGTCVKLIPIDGLCLGYEKLGLCADSNAHCIDDGGGSLTCQCRKPFVPANGKCKQSSPSSTSTQLSTHTKTSHVSITTMKTTQPTTVTCTYVSVQRKKDITKLKDQITEFEREYASLKKQFEESAIQDPKTIQEYSDKISQLESKLSDSENFVNVITGLNKQTQTWIIEQEENTKPKNVTTMKTPPSTTVTSPENPLKFSLDNVHATTSIQGRILYPQDSLNAAVTILVDGKPTPSFHIYGTYFSINHLSPGICYAVQLALVVNSLSRKSGLQTGCTYPDAPNNLKSLQQTTEKIALNITKGLGHFDHFIVYVNGKQQGTIQNLTEPFIYYVINGLDAGMSYTVYVVAVANGLNSATSNTLQTQTYPFPPSKIVMIRHDHNSIDINIFKGSGHADYYNVYLNDKKIKQLRVSKSPINTVLCHIDGLNPHTFYNIYLIAVSNGYNSNRSQELHILTDVAPSKSHFSAGVIAGISISCIVGTSILLAISWFVIRPKLLKRRSGKKQII